MSYRDRDQGQDWDARAGDEGWEERIKQVILSAVTRCSECRRRYHLDDFAVIGHRDHLWMVTVVCEGCHSQGFITAIVEDPSQLSGETAEARPVGRRRRPQLSDLTPVEATRFAGAAPVDSLDLLDLHEFLADFDGDFKTLFDRKA